MEIVSSISPSVIENLIPINLIDNHIDNNNLEDIKKRVDNWLALNPDLFKHTNEAFGLKSGDVITFIGGYDENVAFTSEIFGFNSETGDAYVFWDCYWFPLNLEKRFIKKLN